MTAWTATSNATTWIGHVIPCPHCTGRDRWTYDFHGHWFTLCAHCGAEL